MMVKRTLTHRKEQDIPPSKNKGKMIHEKETTLD
jgi:hypothetical protein